MKVTKIPLVTTHVIDLTDDDRHKLSEVLTAATFKGQGKWYALSLDEIGFAERLLSEISQ